MLSSNEKSIINHKLEMDVYIQFHLFLQAVMSANDMFAPRASNSKEQRMFKDEVTKYFDRSYLDEEEDERPHVAVIGQ